MTHPLEKANNNSNNFNDDNTKKKNNRIYYNYFKEKNIVEPGFNMADLTSRIRWIRNNMEQLYGAFEI